MSSARSKSSLPLKSNYTINDPDEPVETKRTSELPAINVSLPHGFRQVVEDLTREVLRQRPADINSFAMHYFDVLVNARMSIDVDQPGSFAIPSSVNPSSATAYGTGDSVRGSKVGTLIGHYQSSDLDMSLSDSKASAAASTIQRAYRGHALRASQRIDEEAPNRISGEAADAAADDVGSRKGSVGDGIRATNELGQVSQEDVTQSNGDGAIERTSSKRSSRLVSQEEVTQSNGDEAIEHTSSQRNSREVSQEDITQSNGDGAIERASSKRNSRQVSQEEVTQPNGDEAIERASSNRNSRQVSQEEVTQPNGDEAIVRASSKRNSSVAKDGSTRDSAVKVPSGDAVERTGGSSVWSARDDSETVDAATEERLLSGIRLSNALGHISGEEDKSVTADASGRSSSKRESINVGDALSDEQQQQAADETAATSEEKLPDQERFSSRSIEAEERLSAIRADVESRISDKISERISSRQRRSEERLSALAGRLSAERLSRKEAGQDDDDAAAAAQPETPMANVDEQAPSAEAISKKSSSGTESTKEIVSAPSDAVEYFHGAGTVGAATPGDSTEGDPLTTTDTIDERLSGSVQVDASRASVEGGAADRKRSSRVDEAYVAGKPSNELENSTFAMAARLSSTSRAVQRDGSAAVSQAVVAISRLGGNAALEDDADNDDEDD